MNEDDRLRRVEIDEGERFLAGFPTASPSPSAVAHIKLAIRAELARGIQPPTRSWATWHGVLAAAAALAIAVTVGWLSARQHGPASLVATDAEPESSWLADTNREAVALTDLEKQLSALEAWSEDNAWDVSGTALYETLHNALDDAPKGNNPTDEGASAAPHLTAQRSEEV